LQHINDRLLNIMKRRVTRKQIETLLKKLRQRVPGIAIRTTFIAGSPTETDAEHQELVRFVRDFAFDMMGVFPFSAEPGTAMGRMEGQLPDEVKRQRVEELMLTQQEVAFARARQSVGRTVEVLIDRVDRDAGTPVYTARTPWQAPEIDSCVFVRSHRALHPGELLPVTITDFQRYDLIAQVPRSKSRSLKVVGG
jgi:ribosomal protein S12 methylthiotransferase